MSAQFVLPFNIQFEKGKKVEFLDKLVSVHLCTEWMTVMKIPVLFFDQPALLR